MKWAPRAILILCSLALLAVSMGVSAQEAPQPPEESAPSPELPELGPVLFAKSLTGASTFPSWTCPTGRNTAESVGEGHIFKVRGKCNDDDSIAAIGLKLTDILFPDGEVRLEVKVVSGHPRASFILGFRDQGEPGTISSDNYQAVVVPGLVSAALVRGSAGGNTPLLVREDVAEVLARDDWNSVAVRSRGSDLWFLLNDQLVGYATDSSFDSGRIFFALRRLADPNDTTESAAVIRNFRVSRLAAGDPARVPAMP
jgi:hypothetical protein